MNPRKWKPSDLRIVVEHKPDWAEKRPILSGGGKVLSVISNVIVMPPGLVNWYLKVIGLPRNVASHRNWMWSEKWEVRSKYQ